MAFEVAKGANSAAVNAKAAPNHSGFMAARESLNLCKRSAARPSNPVPSNNREDGSGASDKP
jgi:hypothetical protein